MKPISTISLIAFVAISVSASAQSDKFTIKKSQTSAAEYYVSNFGVFGNNVADANAGFIFPRGSRRAYLYGSGVWFGTVKTIRDTARKLVFMAYNPNSGASWATPGNENGVDDDPSFYYSGDYERNSGLNVASTTPTWPLWVATDATISTRYPGTYEPRLTLRAAGGDYSGPSFMPGVDEQFVARYHDRDLLRYEGFGDEFGFPIGLQFTQNTYSWNGGELMSAVVLQYEIVNMSNDTLRDCVIGQVSDPDIGTSGNDHAAMFRGVDGKVRAGIAYTEPESQPTPFDVLAQILLESPAIDQSGFVDNSRRRELSRSHEIHTFRNWRLEQDLTTLVDRYDFMSGPALDIDDIAADKRTVVAGAPFSMRPGDTAHFTIAFGIASSPFGRIRDRGDRDKLQNSGAALVPTIDDLTQKLLGDYELGAFSSGFPSSVASDDVMRRSLSVRPNPASDHASVQFAVSSLSSVRVRIYNSIGVEVASNALGAYPVGSHDAMIDVADLASGTYLIVVSAGDTRQTTTLVVSR